MTATAIGDAGDIEHRAGCPADRVEPISYLGVDYQRCLTCGRGSLPEPPPGAVGPMAGAQAHGDGVTMSPAPRIRKAPR
jgi:hypothetical protein